MTAEAPRKLIDRARQWVEVVEEDADMSDLPRGAALINELAQSLERSEQSLQQAREILREVAALECPFSDAPDGCHCIGGDGYGSRQDQLPLRIRQFLAQHGPDGG